jgi:polysaccharide pyruvyl transferase WcaK-like protein
MGVRDNLQTVGFGISSILQAIRKSDVFIMTGGTHLHDEDGPSIRRIKVFLLYTLLASFGRLLGRAPLLFGHGLGPLSGSWSTMLARVILNNAERVFVRDRDSFVLAGSLGAGEKCVQGFDCSAALIKRRLALMGTESEKNDRMILGISLLPVHDIYSNDMGKDDDIVQSLAMCLKSIIRDDESIIVRLFAYRTGQRHSDLPLLADLQKNTHAQVDRIELVQYDGDIGGFLGSVEECSYCIGMRYHASVFAYLFNKPQIILDYMGKCRSLGKEIALNDTAIIPISHMVLPQFCNRVRSFLLEPGRYLADLPAGVAMMRTESMFDSLNDELGTLSE